MRRESVGNKWPLGKLGQEILNTANIGLHVAIKRKRTMPGYGRKTLNTRSSSRIFPRSFDNSWGVQYEQRQPLLARIVRHDEM